jgi:glycosyltransferase involved in cell wall biosynthesis
MRLSAIIITKNEAANIEACLRSVAFADERIVVDSGSTDDTVALARATGARVLERPDWIGFGAQKNRALAAATGDWVLSIDADERVPPELATEIGEAIATDRCDGFEIRSATTFFGRRVRFSEYYANARSVRLFRNGSGRFTDSLVHENVRLDSDRRGVLRNAFVHHSYVEPETYLRKLQQYTTLSAQMLFDRGKRAGYAACVLHSAAAFLKSYVIRLGFLDGRAGLMVAILLAETTYHKYFKLMLLTEREKAPTDPRK